MAEKEEDKDGGTRSLSSAVYGELWSQALDVITADDDEEIQRILQQHQLPDEDILEEKIEEHQQSDE